MKKLISGILCAVISGSSAAFASSGDSAVITNIGSGSQTYEISVEPGYYTITADVIGSYTDGEKSVCCVYAKGGGYTESSVSVPQIDSARRIRLDGVGTTDGTIVIGISSNGYSSITVSNISAEKTDEPYRFLQGGDITQVSYIEDLGGAYKDADGNPVDPIEYLANSGMNIARVRLSNNPGKGRGDGTYYMPEGYQDEDDCLSLSKRAKDAGMELQFTFNYSDYWSNGERQIIPSDWAEEIQSEYGYDVNDAEFLRSMTETQRELIIDKLAELVHNYTYDIMQKLKDQGTTPEYVSLGNEINGGIFFPFANTYEAYLDADTHSLIWEDIDESVDIKCPMDWNALADILNSGYDAVKEVSPETQVIIHIAEGSKASTFTWFFDKYLAAGGKWDITGASYYPAWSDNTVETCVSFCDEIGEKYGKKIMIMESGFNWNETRKDGYPGQLAEIDAYKDVYPPTKAGHKLFMEDLISGLRTSEYCMGDIYWDPCMIHVEDADGTNLSGWAYRESDDGVEANVVENSALFDFDGNAIPSIAVYTENSYSVPESGNIALCKVFYDEDGRMIKASRQTDNDENGANENVKYFYFAG